MVKMLDKIGKYIDLMRSKGVLVLKVQGEGLEIQLDADADIVPIADFTIEDSELEGFTSSSTHRDVSPQDDSELYADGVVPSLDRK